MTKCNDNDDISTFYLYFMFSDNGELGLDNIGVCNKSREVWAYLWVFCWLTRAHY